METSVLGLNPVFKNITKDEYQDAYLAMYNSQNGTNFTTLPASELELVNEKYKAYDAEMGRQITFELNVQSTNPGFSPSDGDSYNNYISYQADIAELSYDPTETKYNPVLEKDSQFFETWSKSDEYKKIQEIRQYEDEIKFANASAGIIEDDEEVHQRAVDTYEELNNVPTVSVQDSSDTIPEQSPVLEKRDPISTNYNGNILYLDWDSVDSGKAEMESLSESMKKRSAEIEKADSCFKSISFPYNCLVPKPTYSGIKGDIDTAIDTVLDDAVKEIYNIAGAIDRYSKNAISEGDIDILNRITARRGGGPTGSDDSGGDDGSLRLEDLEIINSPLGDNESLEILASDDSMEVVNLNDEILTSPDLDLFEPSQSITSNYIDSELNSSDEELLSDLGANLSNKGTSLFDNITLPGIKTSKNDGVKRSNSIGIAAAAAALAVTGLGGKIFYDSKQLSDDEQTDNVDVEDDIVGEADSGAVIEKETENLVATIIADDSNDKYKEIASEALKYKLRIFDDEDGDL